MKVLCHWWWEKVVTVTDFVFLSSKITADGDCSHEIKRHFLLGRNAMTNLDSILKSRDITLPTKVCLVKAMVLPVVMCGCESWTMKHTELRRVDAFELCCWRLSRVPWTAKRSNQSILKEISPEHWLEGLMLKLKLQYFGYLMQRVDSLEKTLMLGKIESRRRRVNRGWDGGWHYRHNGHEFEQTLGGNDREAWCAAVNGVTKTQHNLATEQEQQQATDATHHPTVHS